MGAGPVLPLHFSPGVLTVQQEENKAALGPGLWPHSPSPPSAAVNPSFLTSAVWAVRRPRGRSEHQPIHLTTSKQPLSSPWAQAGTSWGPAEHTVAWEEGRARTGAWEGFPACVCGGGGGGCWELFRSALLSAMGAGDTRIGPGSSPEGQVPWPGPPCQAQCGCSMTQSQDTCSAPGTPEARDRAR